MNDLEINNDKIEVAVLDTLIQNQEQQPIMIPQLDIDCFTTTIRREIFEAVSDLAEQEKEIDLLSVEIWLKRNRRWSNEDCKYFQKLTTNNVIYRDPTQEIKELNDLKTKRKLDKGLSDLIIMNREPSVSAMETRAKAENIIRDQVNSNQVPGSSMDEIEEREANSTKGEQLMTGDPFFDQTFFQHVGSRKGQYDVLLGISKHGKTYEALRRVYHYAQQGYKGAVITLEANDRFIWDRLVRYFGGNNPNIIIIDPSEANNLEEIIQAVKYWKAAWGLDYFIIDYIQAVPVNDIPFQKELSRIVTTSRSLANFCSSEDLYCLALAQPSKMDQSRRRGYNMMPKVWDIYGSTQIQKDAFMVSNIFRPREVEELCFHRKDGSVKGVQAPGSRDPADMLPKNTVFLQQNVVREGKKYQGLVKLFHTDEGLERAVHNQAEKGT